MPRTGGTAATGDGTQERAHDETGFAATKATYHPSLTGPGDVVRKPLANPLATAVAALVVGALAYQAVSLGVRDPVAGAVVAVAGGAAYALARVAWRVENEYVATELARADLDPDRPDPGVDRTAD